METFPFPFPHPIPNHHPLIYLCPHLFASKHQFFFLSLFEKKKREKKISLPEATDIMSSSMYKWTEHDSSTIDSQLIIVAMLLLLFHPSFLLFHLFIHTKPTEWTERREKKKEERKKIKLIVNNDSMIVIIAASEAYGLKLRKFMLTHKKKTEKNFIHKEGKKKKQIHLNEKK